MNSPEGHSIKSLANQLARPWVAPEIDGANQVRWQSSSYLRRGVWPHRRFKKTRSGQQQSKAAGDSDVCAISREVWTATVRVSNGDMARVIRTDFARALWEDPVQEAA